jgi:3-oxoacyl-[acyl-carrier-protein] synthase II
MKRRIVVTGAGLVSPVGNDLESVWSACVAGRSGIRRVTLLDVSDYPTQIAAEVPDFDPDRYLDPKVAKRCDRFCQLGLSAGLQALANSGLEIDEGNRQRVGVLLSSGIGGMEIWEEQFERLLNGGPSRVSPFLIPMMIGNMASGVFSMLTDARGPNLAVVTACATSAHAIGLATDLIRLGRADAFITGGSEASVRPTAFAGFCSARAMSRRNDDPTRACRPFDQERDGFVMGEGGAAVVLEELEFARARGATILAEVLGYGMSGDAFHMTAPRPDGSGAAQAMRAALEDAGVGPSDVGYVNAHAPGTQEGDAMEAAAIHQVFGDRVPVSSTKPIHGHLLGAAGATEMLICVEAIRHGMVPASLNCEQPDENITIDIVRGAPRATPVEVALSNSFGFGGHNACLVVGPPPE